MAGLCKYADAVGGWLPNLGEGSRNYGSLDNHISFVVAILLLEMNVALDLPRSSYHRSLFRCTAEQHRNLTTLTHRHKTVEDEAMWRGKWGEAIECAGLSRTRDEGKLYFSTMQCREDI